MPYNKTNWTETTPINTTNLQKIEDGIEAVETEVAAHKANDAIHLTSNNVNAQIEQKDFKTYKSNKDANGIFTIVEHKRSDGTLAIKSVLSSGTSPQYTTRTIEYYGSDGVTIEKTTTFTLSYDADGVLISEV